MASALPFPTMATRPAVAVAPRPSTHLRPSVTYLVHIDTGDTMRYAIVQCRSAHVDLRGRFHPLTYALQPLSATTCYLFSDVWQPCESTLAGTLGTGDGASVDVCLSFFAAADTV